MAVNVTYDAPSNTITVTGGTEGTPATFADVQAANDAGGWGVCSNPATNIYILGANVDFGDGSTPTYFQSTREMVYFNDDVFAYVYSNAVLSLGALYFDWSINGSFWSFGSSVQTSIKFLNGGTLNLYASTIQTRGRVRIEFFDGNLTIYSSILDGGYDIYADINYSHFWFREPLDSMDIKDAYFANLGQFRLNMSYTWEDVKLHSIAEIVANGLTCEFDDMLFSHISNLVLETYGQAFMRIMNPKETIEAIPKNIKSNYKVISEEYSINIHIADKDGNPIQNAIVSITDDQGNLVSAEQVGTTPLAEDIDSSQTEINVNNGEDFSEGDIIRIGQEYMYIDSIAGNTLTVIREYYGHDYYPAEILNARTKVFKVGNLLTDANGNIPEVWLPYKFWWGTSEKEHNRNPYKFTISKTGYETLVLDNITVDKPIDWHLELLPELAEADVREAVSFGEGKVGTLDLPSVNDVEKGVQFDNLTKTGILKVPAEADVRQGEGYGANDNEFTGELDLPAITDVREGVKFDSETKEGTLDLPETKDVREGIKYDNETKEGKMDLPAEEDVEKGVKYDSETKTGNFEAPAEADVKKGVGYGANGTEFEGNYEADFPAEEDVEKDVAYDEGAKVGKFHVPAEEDVEVGVGYGANGTEFEGTYLGLRGDNLVAYLQKKVSLTGELRS